MVDKVGLKEYEYMDLEEGIRRLHQEIIEQVELATTAMETLNCPDGGFYMEQLSNKVQDVVDEFRNIASDISGIYSAHEEIVGKFQTSIDDYDTCC